ncbi:ABC transporter substrate-binding protein [Dongia sp.]|uniref:ABC transporter substrate-binding protein n=1 Tax=Dongia sp. TaxID=1977262 RepID=UPI0035B4A875
MRLSAIRARLAASVMTIVAGTTFAGIAGAQEKLVLYTSQPAEQMEAVLQKFKAVNPGIEIEMFRSGTTEIMNKLQAEMAAGEPKADVLLVADSVTMDDLKAQDMLQPYSEADVSRLPESQYDKDKTYFGTKLITTGIIYNTAAGKPKPTSWQDLLSEDAKGQVIMPSPLYSGAAVIHVGTMAAQPEFGWEYFEKLADNDAIAVKGNGAVRDAVARGEKAYGVIVEYMAFDQKTKGSPVDFVFPAEGVTAINQPVGILKTAKNVAAAKKFIDYQLSDDAQKDAVTQAYFPLVKGIEPPAGYPDPAGLKIISTDPAVLLKGTEETKKRFADLYGG